MFKKIIAVIKILPVLLTLELLLNPLAFCASNVVFSEFNKPLLIVIVDSKIYDAIESSLNLYKMDVTSEGFSVNIIETNQLPDKTPMGIKSYLREAISKGLTGVLFVGDIPEVWYEVNGKEFPTDRYYEDLDGLWRDLDNDGIYDEHNGDITPEIWVGRLKASTLSGNEIQLLKNYFNKNHRYRNGSRILPWWRTLAYIDDDGVDWVEEVRISLSQVSTDITLVADPAITNAEDFRARLKDPCGYQWLYLMSHGSFDYHNFEIYDELEGGTIFSWEYQTIDPRILFYLFFTCFAARYVEQDYLAGSAVFADTYGLLAIGCTDSMFSVSFRKFFAALSEGDSIGTALQKWFQDQCMELNPLIFYGLTIIGDPTLKPYVRRELKFHDVSITNVDLRFQNHDSENEESLLITVDIENKGNFTESFNFMIKLYSFTLTSFQLSLTAKSRTTLNYRVTKPYKIVFLNSSKTMLNIIVDNILEEFNLADNIRQINLEGVAIVKPERCFSPRMLESIIVVFLIVLITAYIFFKLVISENIFMVKSLVKKFLHPRNES